jgi:hypothetical protein
VARLDSVSAFDDLPGVGTGPDRPGRSSQPEMGLLLIVALIAIFTGTGAIFWKRRIDRRSRD